MVLQIVDQVTLNAKGRSSRRGSVRSLGLGSNNNG